MAHAMYQAFENETYKAEESERPSNIYSNEMASVICPQESRRDRGDHAHLNSESSLTPLISSESPGGELLVDKDNCGNRKDLDMLSLTKRNGPERSVSVNSEGGMPLPPAPHSKPQPRVFSKKAKGVSGDPMPIPGSQKRSQDRLRSHDSGVEPELWEMSPKGSGDFSVQAASLTPSASPPDLSFSRDFDQDSSLENIPGTACPYLTPIDPDEPEHQSNGSFSERVAGGPSSPVTEPSFGSLTRRENGEPHHIRFDSGVGDSDSERSSKRVRTTSDAPSSIASSSYPRLRLSTHYEQHYEDIDAYRKYIRPENTASTSQPKPSNGVAHNGLPAGAPRVNIQGVTNTDSDDHTHRAAVQRFAQRPYLDPRNASLPHTYSPLDMNRYANQTKSETVKPAHSVKTRGFCCCLVTVLVLIFFMTSAALSLGIYLLIKDGETTSTVTISPSVNTVITNSSGQVQIVDDLQETLASLQTDVDRFKRENAALKSELDKLKSHVTNEVQPLYRELTLLTTQQRDTVASMRVLENHLTTAIANISLTPGPQGPTGVANFSLCEHRFLSEIKASSPRYTTDTRYLPDDSDLQNLFVLFAYCDKKGATGTQLKRQTVTVSNVEYYKYKCVCSGQVSGEVSTVCTVHAIVCPTLQGASVAQWITNPP
ncbi:hypothetical protein PoB_003763900 [Plakobranchus ocellatus]|uniref:SUN domain-containing protein n=1 Tax=Plakobranchus ocellatus TaxID=259542 RepID=A0AAV4ATK8_9GAST|nr:hypothetical protein PoB_003763900 [Plakobranchus ocellatus]